MVFILRGVKTIGGRSHWFIPKESPCRGCGTLNP
jgi:hypothetical protein